MLQAVAGGAAADPLRPITKRSGWIFTCDRTGTLSEAIIGGRFNKVYELNRNFERREFPRHNPEFTMLEAYWAYADFEDCGSGGGNDLSCGGRRWSGHSVSNIAAEERDANDQSERPWRRARYQVGAGNGGHGLV